MSACICCAGDEGQGGAGTYHLLTFICASAKSVQNCRTASKAVGGTCTEVADYQHNIIAA